VGKHSLRVSGVEIEASAAVIATGSTPRLLDFPGAEFVKTSDDILALRRPPETLVIIGAGVVAFEFGQVFARLGSKVLILARGNRVLAGHDEELVQVLVEHSATLGLQVLQGTTIRTLCPRGNGQFLVEYEQDGVAREVMAGFVLNAAGRVPAIRDLSLEAADVKWSERGVQVNEFLRSSSNDKIFAAGDAHGRLQLSPIASYEGRIVARNFLEGDVEPADYSTIPRALYTVPPLASVGLTEAEARKRKINASVQRSDMSRWRAFDIIEAEPLARAKVLLDSTGDRVLGAHLLCPQAADLIHIFAMAIKFKIPASDLKSMVYAYPTLSSAVPYMLG
jgi:glutathione reductase (NADPH)